MSPSDAKSKAVRAGRPLGRRIVKLACQIFLGSRRAHFHAWLPSLGIEGRKPGSPGRVSFRKRPVLDLLAAAALAAQSGERILIIGSGPSVSGQPIAGLPPRSAILLNGAISLIGDTIAVPLAVAVEDERFIWRHFALVRDKLAAETLCLFSAGVLNAICLLDRDWLAGRSVLLIDDIRKPYGRPRRSDEELRAFDFVHVEGNAGFSEDADQGVFQGGSVVISALQFALETKAREIGLLGIDISNADSPRFYETAGNTAFSGIVGAERRILAHIALARDFAAAKGVALFNHSPVSALRSIGLDYRPLDQMAV